MVRLAGRLTAHAGAAPFCRQQNAFGVGEAKLVVGVVGEPLAAGRVLATVEAGGFAVLESML